VEMFGDFCKNVGGEFFSSRCPYVVHKLSQSKLPLLVRTLHELAKTRDHFAIPYGQLTRFGQNHTSGGFRLSKFWELMGT
jgi:hypothetical protein